MDYKKWLDNDGTEEFIKGFMDVMFLANGIDPATVPARIQQEEQGVFIPDKEAVDKVCRMYKHLKTAFAGTNARADVVTNDGTLFHHCLIKVRCNGFTMDDNQAAEFFKACRIAHSIDILPDDPESEPAKDGYCLTVTLFADKKYEPVELGEPETDIETICDSIFAAEIESFLDEYAVFKPETNEIEIQAVELDFLTSKSPVMEALRLAKSLNCQVDDENLIMNIGF